jgi:hypothetical protein
MNFAGSNGSRRPCLLACVAMTAAGSAFANVDAAGTEVNPYSIISQRNVFRLAPPPPPSNSAADKPADLPKVMLTGFMETAHVMRVLLAKPPKNATNATTYLSLKAGERKDGVEVLRIRPEKEEVDIINSGTPMTLCAASNSYVGSGTAPKGVGGTAAIPPMPGPPGLRPTPLTAGGMTPAAALPDASLFVPTATGSSVTIAGGAGFGASPTPGAGSANPRSPNAALPGSALGTGMPGATPSAATPFYGGSGGTAAGLASPPTSATGPTSLSEADLIKYMNGQAIQNPGTSPAPPPPPRP